MKVIKLNRYCRQLLRLTYTLGRWREKRLEGRLREVRGNSVEALARGGCGRRQGWFAPPAEVARKAQGADWKRVARMETGQDGRARGENRGGWNERLVSTLAHFVNPPTRCKPGSAILTFPPHVASKIHPGLPPPIVALYPSRPPPRNARDHERPLKQTFRAFYLIFYT